MISYSLYSKMSVLANELGEELYTKLLKIRLADGSILFDESDPITIFEISTMIRQSLDPEEFIDALKLSAASSKTPKEVIFDTSFFDEARNIHYQRIASLRGDTFIREMSDETCRKCHKKTVEYFTVQVRSGDEGMTTFFKCWNCGHGWRVNA